MTTDVSISDCLKEMMSAVERQPEPELWTTIKIDDVEVPMFKGTSRTHRVDAWRAVDKAIQSKFWMFGAIAFSLGRTSGGRQQDETEIQKFIKSVGIGRNTFQRVSKTYGVFIGTRTTGGTRFINEEPFKLFEVAARLTDSAEDAVAAVALAHSLKWRANRLERSLASARPRPKPPVILQKLFNRLAEIINALPAHTKKHVPGMLRWLCRNVEWSLSPSHDRDFLPPSIRDIVGPNVPAYVSNLVVAEDDDDLPDFLRDLVVADSSDPIGEHDEEREREILLHHPTAMEVAVQ